MASCPNTAPFALVCCAFALCSAACSDDSSARADIGPSGSDGLGGADLRPTDGATNDAPRPLDIGLVAARCVPQAALDSLSQPFSCQTRAKVKASTQQLPHDCHSQGIAWHPGTQSFVVTCMDQGSGTSGRILAYPAAANDAGQWLASSAAKLHVASDTSHPSAIQIDQHVFPVAMAKSASAGPSFIRFYRITAGAQPGSPELNGPLGQGLTHDKSHVGALAYATLGGTTHMIGCGWDCATISFWSAAGVEQTSGLTLVQHASTQSLVSAGGVDSKVGKYNSLYLTRRCGDEAPLLFASHEDWLDVWELSKLGTGAVTMRKVIKRKISEGVVKWKDRPIFYEGMTMEITPSQGLRFWAAPHDYGTSSCPSGTRCMQYVYRCRFGS